MTTPRPTAVGYISAPTTGGLQQQRELLAGYAAREGFALLHVVADARDGVTLSELVDLAERHDAVHVLVPASNLMAARHQAVTELLKRTDAVCTVVPGSAAGFGTVPGPRHLGLMIALDVDGTLTVEGRGDVPGETAEAVAQVRAAGHDIVIASGRSLVGLVPIIQALELETGWIVASNGAVTARLDPQAPSGYIVQDAHMLDVEPVARLALDLVPGVRLGVEEIGVGYRVTARFGRGQVSGEQRVVGLDELFAEPTPRLILAAPGVVTALVEPVRALGLTANTVGADWIDATPPGLSKASALEEIRQRLGVSPERTVAVGDGGNDRPMFEWAARAVAMGNAPAAVREAADETTGTVEEQGVVHVLHSLLNPQLVAPIPAEVTS